jgi:hypothetical protein
MEMHQVHYFLAVSEELNFTRASEKCNVTQPSLSHAIKLLEEELGGPLFHRGREFAHFMLGPERIEARTIIWAAGVMASPAGARLGAATDRAGV